MNVNRKLFSSATVAALFFATGAFAQEPMHWHEAAVPPMSVPQELAAAKPMSIASCVDAEKRFGYRGYEHCRLHPKYQDAFKDWNCMCYTGQCRPTKFRVALGANSQTGYEIYINGEWFDIPLAALRTAKANMTPELLEYDAHVCSNDPPKPHIECAWIKLPS